MREEIFFEEIEGLARMELRSTISTGLWQSLHEHAGRTKEPLSHIVSAALAQYLEVPHHTLYQVSTATAILEGIYKGAVRVGTLREHGDLGIGTFENLDGEMVAVDGDYYQVRGDGSVRVCDDNTLSPFAVVTRFEPGVEATLDQCDSMKSLTARFDSLRNSDNLFYAMRVDGKFSYVHVRAMCPTKPGVALIEAAATQPEFEFQNVTGTLVGFWTPEYAKTLNVAGYHLHFLSADRKCGGHLLQVRGENLRLQLQGEGNFRIALPESEAFLKADLRRDPSAELAIAESEKR